MVLILGKNVLYVLVLVLQTNHTETEFGLNQVLSPALICLILGKFHLGDIFCLTSYHGLHNMSEK